MAASIQASPDISGISVKRMEKEGDHFVYSKAVVCTGIASSLPAAALRLEEPEQAIDMEKAHQQHKAYVAVGI